MEVDLGAAAVAVAVAQDVAATALEWTPAAAILDFAAVAVDFGFVPAARGVAFVGEVAVGSVVAAELDFAEIARELVFVGAEAPCAAFVVVAVASFLE